MTLCLPRPLTNICFFVDVPSSSAPWDHGTHEGHVELGREGVSDNAWCVMAVGWFKPSRLQKMHQRVERRVRNDGENWSKCWKTAGFRQELCQIADAMWVQVIKGYVSSSNWCNNLSKCLRVSSRWSLEHPSKPWTKNDWQQQTIANASDNSPLCTLLICTNLSCYTVFIWCDSTTSNTGRTWWGMQAWQITSLAE